MKYVVIVHSIDQSAKGEHLSSVLESLNKVADQFDRGLGRVGEIQVPYDFFKYLCNSLRTEYGIGYVVSHTIEEKDQTCIVVPNKEYLDDALEVFRTEVQTLVYRVAEQMQTLVTLNEALENAAKSLNNPGRESGDGTE